MQKIKLVDLQRQHEAIKTELDKALNEVLHSTAFVGGYSNRFVRQFEESFAQYVGVRHCVACGNGTDAIEIALKALNVGPGDEVLVPSISWIATSESVSSVGAVPVFIDVQAASLNIDPDKIQEKITPRTKAIIPVHLYGCPSDMDKIMETARKNGLYVIEDCAQAHGATFQGRKVGSFGDLATFSFFPGKNLGAFGDAGAVVTNTDKYSDFCRIYANHGQLEKNNHIMEGRNSRMDAIHAAVLDVKLKYLDEWNDLRRAFAQEYNSLLEDTAILAPTVWRDRKHVYHLYVVRVPHRDRIIQGLIENGVEAAIQYPTALPLLSCYKRLQSAHYPVAEKATKEILSLPMHPFLRNEEVVNVSRLLISIARECQ